ncbi:MAG TPA: hypothetical protein PLZ58_00380 [Candidatus Saccharibacteria bacterium]|nr:hypothetical protein [Candidatus Saccharibacteria bacterium]HRQ07223.1 hypothetical protein [Candidatus Saccharibacteria bacterium]
MATLLIVGLSYGKRRKENEPNPVNRKLGRELVGVIDDKGWHNLIVVSQWEIALQTKKDGYGAHVNLVVDESFASYKNKKRYLDSEDVVNAAINFVKDKGIGIDGVIVVANPFLHLAAVQKLIRSKGLNVIKYPIEKVGFDNSSEQLQWWCKGPLRFITYGIIVKLGDILNRNLHGIGEKE